MKHILTKALLAGALLASSASLSFAADKVVLTMWHGHPEWKNAVEKIIAKFEQENPNIEIQLEEIPGQNLAARLNTALAAGEAPDLFALQLGPTVAAAGKAGQVLDLTDKVDISGSDPAPPRTPPPSTARSGRCRFSAPTRSASITRRRSSPITI